MIAAPVRIKCGIVFAFLAVYVLLRYFKVYRRHCRESKRLANPIFPKLYSDKMLWRKLFDHAPQFVDMTDKLTARDIARTRSNDIRLTEIVWQGGSIEDFPFDAIEKPCIVKYNTGSAWYFVVRDASAETKRSLTETMQKFARQRHYGPKSGEWAYLGIEKRVFAERLLIDANGMPPDDYKMYFCDGELVQMSISHDRWGSRALLHYDKDLRLIEVDRDGWRRDYEPRDWDKRAEVLKIGRQLAGDIDFIRVDVYVFQGTIYFGEFTLYPGSGTGTGVEIDEPRGRKWDIRKSNFFRGDLSFFKRTYLDCLNFAYRDSISPIPSSEGERF
jgi:hypothetical protein